MMKRITTHHYPAGIRGWGIFLCSGVLTLSLGRRDVFFDLSRRPKSRDTFDWSYDDVA